MIYVSGPHTVTQPRSVVFVGAVSWYPLVQLLIAVHSPIHVLLISGGAIHCEGRHDPSHMRSVVAVGAWNWYGAVFDVQLVDGWHTAAGFPVDSPVGLAYIPAEHMPQTRSVDGVGAINSGSEPAHTVKSVHTPLDVPASVGGW